jgi:hypothetical protein
MVGYLPEVRKMLNALAGRGDHESGKSFMHGFAADQTADQGKTAKLREL